MVNTRRMSRKKINDLDSTEFRLKITELEANDFRLRCALRKQKAINTMQKKKIKQLNSKIKFKEQQLIRKIFIIAEQRLEMQRKIAGNHFSILRNMLIEKKIKDNEKNRKPEDDDCEPPMPTITPL